MNEKERIIRLILRLRATAADANGNVNERQTAAAKARDLQATYEVTEDDLLYLPATTEGTTRDREEALMQTALVASGALLVVSFISFLRAVKG